MNKSFYTALLLLLRNPYALAAKDECLSFLRRVRGQAN